MEKRFDIPRTIRRMAIPVLIRCSKSNAIRPCGQVRACELAVPHELPLIDVPCRPRELRDEL